MKPLRLIINAFGPYVDKTDIDFTKFGDNGLYLITGTTGAGKTTIFDALSFALFGQASGSDRKVKSLRSDFVKDEKNVTYVELEFLNHGEKYHIRRECAYETLNRNGNVKSVPEKAVLTRPDGSALSTLKDVEKEINDILGIDRDQFSKIVMIAQGQFRDFLLASTTVKEEIFRKIFRTSLYQDFQRRIDKLYKDTFGEKMTIEKDINKDASNIISAGSDELEEFKGKETVVFVLDELLELLESSVKADEKSNIGYESEQKNLQAKIGELIQQVERAENINKNKEALEKLKKALPELEQQVKEAEDSYKKEKGKDKERDKLAVSIKTLEGSLKEYEEIETTQKELVNAEKELDNSNEVLADYDKQLEKLKKEHDENQAELKALANLSGDIEKNKSEAEKCSNKFKELDSVQSKLKEYRNQQDEYSEQQEKTKSANDEFEAKKRYADEVYLQFLANQAGVLAKELKSGEKCPVCGSIEHPKPAKLSESDVKESDLKKANDERDKAQELSVNEAKKLSSIETTVKKTEDELKKYAKDEFALKGIEGLEEKIETAIETNKAESEKLEAQKSELEKNQTRKSKLEKKVADFESDKKDLDSKIDEVKTRQTELTNRKASLEATIKEKQKKLEYSSKDEALKVLNKNKAELSSLQKALEEAEKLKNDTALKLSQEQGRKSELEKAIPKDSKIDIDKLKSDLSAKQDELAKLQESNKDLSHRYKTNQRILADLTKSKKVFENISKKVEMLDNLNRTANGSLTGGKQKISFENYVLGTYFDEIIYAANQRFKEMTGYQFELRRSEGKSGNAKTGLDLDVFDSYTANSRSVSSLSGGESFKAALALSLGLSDIVQQRAGGVSIDTMFIDEGFGSLDSESLDQTMKTLNELSGNKTLIGIISHVERLREMIDKKITVTKTQSGSKLSINFI